MPEISSRDFGRLEADVKNLTELVRSVDTKINDVMTRSEFNAVVKQLTEIQKNHEARLDDLEQINALRTSSIWNRIAQAADQSFVTFMGKVLFLFFGALIASYFLTQYQLEPRHLDNQVNERGQ